MIRGVILWLLISCGAIFGEEVRKVPFIVPELPVTVNLLLPAEGSIVSEEKSLRGHSMNASSPDGVQGLIVEISDQGGSVLWRHDFGFNMSTGVQGCGISVTYDAKSKSLLVAYNGYKWDHDAKALFVSEDGRLVREYEYAMAQADILPVLKKRSDFPEGFDYKIEPMMTDAGVGFECIPLEKRERQRPHPFAQDEPFYVVEGGFNSSGRFVPSEIRSKREN